MNATKSLNREKLKKLHPEYCIECGLCSYSCTSKINVLDYVTEKAMVRINGNMNENTIFATIINGLKKN